MTDLDLDRLGDVWRQQPDPAEMERLQRAAAAVSKRARIARIVEIVAALALSAIVILLVLANPGPRTAITGAGAILLLLGSDIRQRRLRRIELRSLTGTTEDMLDQSIERLETTLRHIRFGLVVMGPSIAVGLLVSWSAGIAPGGAQRLAVVGSPLLRGLLVGGAIAAVAAFLLFTLARRRRFKRELERLVAMREAYRQEQESTAP